MPLGGDHVRVVSLLIVSALSVQLTSQAPPTLRHAIVGGSDERTRELSTAELEAVLATGGAVVIDARPHGEYVLGHIPGAVNVDGKAGVAASMYVSDVTAVARLVRGDKAIPLVLYCNGPHCGKSKRLADELLDAGHRDVRRYQLGMPVWRAIGGVCQVELEGIRHVVTHDATSVVIDARELALYRAGTLPRARNIPRSLVLDGKDVGEVRRAKDDGRLPMDDHNTRIIVVGSDSTAARYVAEALAREAFHNVGYFAGGFEDVQQALAQR
jgi:rhodanese-related sulfurtransferase